MARAHHIALGATIANTAITAVKFVLAVITGSLALWGEAFHSLADIVTSGLVFVALVMSGRPAAETVKPESPEGEAAPTRRKRMWELLRGLFARRFQTIVAVLIAVMLLGVAWSIFSRVFEGAPAGEPRAVRLPLLGCFVMLLLSGVSLAVSRIELAVAVRERAVALAADGMHARSDMLASGLVAVALFGTALGAQWMDKVGGAIVGALIAILALEIIANVIRALLRSREPEGPPPYQSRMLLAVFRTDAVDGLLEEIDGRFGWKLAGNRLLRKARKVFRPLAAGIALLAVASTSLFTVGPDELAFRKRFGAVVGTEPVRPGLHGKWPWPVETVERIRAYEVTRLGLGYEGEETAPAFLWTKAHYVKEYDFILRDGTEMMTVFMEVFYRPRAGDLRRYAYYGAEDVRTVMEAISYRELLEAISHREFFSTVTTGRDALIRETHAAIQERAESLGLGVEVVEVAFRDMHPPWEVAGAYLDVLSAEEELYMTEYRAKGTHSRYVAQASAKATEVVLGAEKEAQSKILRTRGDTARYRAIRDAYARHGGSLAWRLYLDALEEALARGKCFKYVVESSEAFDLDYWVNFTRPGRE